ncbi:replication factor C subunit 3 [Planoprotostelium fungivorum]|uniref:Replication factor C subunit 3 n=1 Tax=Planoprotostelium fungivorum TaxID=1890364 RepID=A0A2P6NPP5_9EUKA|nr:replication factor C subunit 3 [Planoprotostelium fungivorum]
MSKNDGTLWVDRYRPTSLEKLDIHTDLTNQLKKMCTSDNLPHLLFYGPSGAGKKTRVKAVLRSLFGASVEKVKVEHKAIKINTKTIEISIVSSSHHVEVNPSDVEFQDRVVVQEIIKEIAQSVPLDAGTAQKSFKVVVLHEVDKLSKDAQHALRRTMEKYVATCRLILVCNSTSKVIDPLRSRCLPVRVPLPTIKEITSTLQSIAKKEGVNLSTDLANRIAEQSGRNLRKAILSFEAAKVKQYPFAPNQVIERADWEDFIKQMADEISQEQSPQRLQLIRSRFYELLVHCIPPEIIMKNLTMELLGRVDTELKYDVVKWAAHYEQRMQTGSKPIFHLEAFVAKFMSLYKQFLSGLLE